MKKYIGKKEVTAKPMSAELAISKGFNTSTCSGKDEGYEVIYENGCSYWSPKDVFEKAYQLAETPLDRLCIEYNDIFNKYKELSLFMLHHEAYKTYKFDIDYQLMEVQRNIMKDYIRTLKIRIEILKNK